MQQANTAVSTPVSTLLGVTIVAVLKDTRGPEITYVQVSLLVKS